MSRTVRYRLVNKIAHGGMAEIFLAVQAGVEGFEKQVVLKRILPALAADPSFVRMLVDEAHIASMLNHSNLVQVLDLGRSDDEFFLVLEFVDGWSLEHVRRRAQKARMKLPLPLALYITGALCRALAYVHTRKRGGRPLGIVHRDVNPQNVLLSREGEVKLADFGIAKAIGKREKSATGVIKGKFAYMSPEQSIGAELDARSDLFAVGTLLYILTTGKKPFEGATDLDLLMQVRKARYEKPSNLVKDFNPDVERFIARALRADRARRWQSAGQMGDRIDAILLKLGLASGAAPLKRWLDNLAAKDGVKPPADLTEPTAVTGTVQLGSRDIELHDLALSPAGAGANGVDDGGVVAGDSVADAGEQFGTDVNLDADGDVAWYADAVVADPDIDADEDSEAHDADDVEPDPQVNASAYVNAERRPPSQPRMPGIAGVASGSGALDQPSVDPARRSASPLPQLSAPRPPVPRPPAHSRGLGRGLVRATFGTVVVVMLLGGAGYFAQPYLPPRLVTPVRDWLHQLPGRVRPHLPALPWQRALQ